MQENNALPKHLLYWLNSVPKPSCALADYCADLQDGTVFADVLQFVERRTLPALEESSPKALHFAVIRHVGSTYGWSNVPEELQAGDASTRMAQGDRGLLVLMLDVLYQLHTAKAKVSNERMRAAVSAAARSSSAPRAKKDNVQVGLRTGAPNGTHVQTDSRTQTQDILASAVRGQHLSHTNHRVRQPDATQTAVEKDASVQENGSQATLGQTYCAKSEETPRRRPITATMVNKRGILKWLRRLGVNINAADLDAVFMHVTCGDQERKRSVKERLSNSLINGVLFGEVAAAVEFVSAGNSSDRVRHKMVDMDDGTTKVLLTGVEPKPKTLAQALHNFEIALGVFRKDQRVPSTFLFRSAEIVKGDVDLVWGLLQDLFTAYDSITRTTSRSLSSGRTHVSAHQSPHPRRAVRFADSPVPVTETTPSRGRNVGSCVRRDRDRAQTTKHRALPPRHQKTVHGHQPPSQITTTENMNPNTIDGDAVRFSQNNWKVSPRASGNFNKCRKSRERGKLAWLPPEVLASRTTPLVDHVPPVTAHQQAAVRLWLYHIGLVLPLPEASVPDKVTHFLDDPLRNGVLLCKLLKVLEPAASSHAHLDQILNCRPTTLAEATDNIRRAFWLLRLRKSPPIPERYLLDIEAVLNGHRELVWGLLWEVMQAYPEFRVDQEGSLQMDDDPDSQLPYSPHQRQLLENSLLDWMNEIEVLKEIWGAGRPLSLGNVEASIRDGSLLCAIVKHVTGRPVHGWLTSPKTTKAATRNISKCVEMLRSKRDMGRRYLYIGIEDDLIEGKWTAILGLLEDLHRWADGCPPRPSERFAGEKPYLGESCLNAERASAEPRLGLLNGRQSLSSVDIESMKVEKGNRRRTLDTPMPHPAQRYSPSPMFQDWPSTPGLLTPAAPTFTRTPPRVGRATAADADLLPQRVMPAPTPLSPSPWVRVAPPGVGDDDIVPDQRHISGGIPISQQDLSPTITPRHRAHRSAVTDATAASGSRSKLPQQTSPGSAMHHDDLDDSMEMKRSGAASAQTPRHSSAISTPINKPARGISPSRQPTHQSPLPGLVEDMAGTASMSGHGGKQPNKTTEPDQLREAKVRAILKLKSWFGALGIPHASLALLQEEFAPEWSDGVLLCRLVERLERIRGTLPGTTHDPKTRAQRVQNIRRVLERLERKQTIPLTMLACDDDILEGRSEVLLPLLLRIRKAFGGSATSSVRHSVAKDKDAAKGSARPHSH